MKKRLKRKGEKFFNNQVKKTLPYQLLIISLIVLVILIFVWIVLFLFDKVSYFPKGEGLEGELGTLKWDINGQEVFLKLLSYNISEDNQTMQVGFNWSEGDGDFRAILFDFEGIVECNYTNSSVPNFGDNQTYIINYAQTSCVLNFENTTNVFVYAQINIPLTQTNLIENITLYNDDSGIDILDLDDYFNCLENISFSSIEDPTNDYTLLKINSITNLITLIKGSGWYGFQKFDLTASCDGDVLDVSTNGKNMSFYIIVVDSNRPIPNNAPEFLDEDCDDLEWKINTNYFIDMGNCFKDDDDDDLEFRYRDVSGYNDNLTIEIDGEELKLIPDKDWIGFGYFYIYADDSTDETSGKVYFDVVADTTSTSASTTSTTTSDILKIKSSNPSSSTVNLFANKTKKFTITAQNYKSIKWYLDGKMVREGGLSYNFKETDEGSYVIKVEIVNGTVTDSKTWNLSVQKEDEIEEISFKPGDVIFYLIVGIILIIIFLVLWLFVVEKNSKKRKINYVGFGVSGSKNSKI